MSLKLAALFKEMPIVAVLRYIQPEEAAEIGDALYRAGIRIMEITLNSPDPFRSIDTLKQALGDQAIVGAGTVLTAEEVDRVAEVGGEIAVAPNTDTQVIQRAIAKGIVPMPGFATATEALSAYHAGARYLKLFPIATYGAGHIKALSTVLPADVLLLAVGGVGTKNAKEMLQAGAHGLGTGTEVYRRGDSAESVHKKALEIVDLVRTALC